MIDFIKCNWKNLLGIVVCVAAGVVLNAHILHITQGHYNIIEFIFI